MTEFMLILKFELELTEILNIRPAVFLVNLRNLKLFLHSHISSQFYSVFLIENEVFKNILKFNSKVCMSAIIEARKPVN